MGSSDGSLEIIKVLDKRIRWKSCRQAFPFAVPFSTCAMSDAINVENLSALDTDGAIKRALHSLAGCPRLFDKAAMKTLVDARLAQGGWLQYLDRTIYFLPEKNCFAMKFIAGNQVTHVVFGGGGTGSSFRAGGIQDIARTTALILILGDLFA